jgi:hypothetical protein
MRSEIVGLREIGFIGGDERYSEFIGNIDEARLGAILGFKIVALQLDIEPVAEHSVKLGQPVAGKRRLSLHQGFVHRTRRASRQADQPLAVQFEQRPRHMRLGMVGRVEIGAARQFHQIGITRRILGEERQHSALMLCGKPVVLRQIIEIDLQAAADDRLNAFLRQRFRKFERSEEIARIRDRQRRHGMHLGHVRKLLDRQCPFRERIGGMDPQMDKGCRRIVHGSRG